MNVFVKHWEVNHTTISVVIFIYISKLKLINLISSRKNCHIALKSGDSWPKLKKWEPC